MCPSYQLGKHVKLPFSLSNTVFVSPVDLVHSDVWTSPVTSISGIMYYVIFLDNFYHFLWVYPLREKCDVYSKFIYFRSLVQNQFKTNIKVLQCDNGGEYNNNQFHHLCAKNDIEMRFSCPHTSQQNAKSERMLWSIHNIVRTLLFQCRLLPEYCSPNGGTPNQHHPIHDH